jgi:hypothetical protein
VIDYGPFEGDGRTRVQPINPPKGTGAIPISRGQARRLIDRFDAVGHTFHSQNGSLVWVPVAWCNARGLKCEVVVQKVDGKIMGYVVEKR